MAALSALAMVAGVQPAHAAGLSADAACRKALAVGVRRVTGAALKGVERCHRNRMRGEVAATVDCNDPGQLTGAALERLQRAIAKLGALANRGCNAAGMPAALGYDPCPTPCGAVAIGTYADVSACLACLAQDRARDLATPLFGTPAPPGKRTSETTCHAALVRAARRYADQRMQTQQQCKTAEEQGGVIGTDCRDGDYEGRISAAWARLQSQVSTDTSCPVASLVALDLCPSATDGTHFRDPTPAIDMLHSCVDGVVNSGTNDLFDRV
jgi:hypothetical protein